MKTEEEIESGIEFKQELVKRRYEEWKSTLFGLWFLATVFIGCLTELALIVLFIKYILTN